MVVQVRRPLNFAQTRHDICLAIAVFLARTERVGEEAMRALLLLLSDLPVKTH